ncbi:MAG: hypothetical protein Q4A60_03855 [Pasteurellaceae bacterium]|nr:hypothetical protein [Pasteurellaceae bacterium]
MKNWQIFGKICPLATALLSMLKLHPKPVLKSLPKGSWIGYLKGIAIFLLLSISFTVLYKSSIVKSISYIVVALLVSIALHRPQDDSWKSANYWAELPFVGFAVMYLVDQGIIQYFC